MEAKMVGANNQSIFNKLTTKLLVIGAALALVFTLPMLIANATGLDPFPSTNDNNRINNWPHVNFAGATPDSVTLDFISPTSVGAVFEYRIDGITPDGRPINDPSNSNHNPCTLSNSSFPAVTCNNLRYIADDEVLYPGYFVTNTTRTETFSANSKVEIRVIRGPERDYDFDWVTFNVAAPADTTKPTISISPIPPKFLSGTESFEVTITDDNPLDPNKNKDTWVELYGDPDWSKKKGDKVNLSSGTGVFTIDTTALPDGKYVLRVGSVADAAGNTSGDKSFKHFTIDNTRPSINLTSPSSGALTNGNFTIAGTAHDANGIEKVLIYVGRRNPSNVFAGYVVEAEEALWDGTNFTYEVTGLPEFNGTYYVRAFAYDPAGNNRSAGADGIVVDTTGPVVTVSPVAGSVLSGTVTFEITVTDDNLDPGSPNTWVYLYNNLPPQKQKGAGVNLSSGFGTFTVDTTLLDDGLATLNVGIVKDAVGNPSGVIDNYFSNYVIDNTAPSVPTAVFTATPSGTVVPDGGYTQEQHFTFNLSSDSDVTRYQLKYWKNTASGEPWWNPTNLSSAEGCSGVSGQLCMDPLGIYTDWFYHGEGVHYFSFSACDAAGNCSAYGTPFSVTYDQTAPTVTIVSPNNNSTHSSNFTVTVNANDFLSGLERVRVRITRVGHGGVVDCSETGLGGLNNYTVDCPINVAALPNGTYIIRADARDLADNQVAEVNRTFFINKPEAQPVFAPLPAQFVPAAANADAVEEIEEADEEIVLGLDSGEDDNGQVQGDTFSTVSAGSTSFLGLGWWWLAILATLAAALWWFIAARRRRNSEA